MANNIKGITVEIGGNTGPLNTALKGVNKTAGDLQSELKEVNKQLKFDPKNTDLLAQKQVLLKREIESTKQKLTTLREAQKQVEQQFQTGEIGEEKYRAFQRELEKTESQLKNLEKQAAQSNATLQKISVGAQSVADGAGKIASKMTPVSVAVAAVGTAAVKVGNDFEAQMSRVSAVSGATGNDLKALNNQALQLGQDTAYSATEAAQGMENLASAGFSTKEIMEAMPGMLDLAASSGEDLANSADIAASTLRGFGLAADQAGHVADVLAKNAADTNAAVADTGAAMKYIAPVALNAGWSLESVTAAIGEMADAGIKGEQAGTTLRGALTNLMNPSSTAADAMQSIGFSAYDASGKMKPLSQIIDELNQKTASLTDEQRDSVIATIMGTNALSGMQVLLKDGSGSLDTLTASLKNSDGAAKNMAQTMQGNTKGAIEQMKGALETAAIKIQEMLAPAITKIAQSVADLASKFSALSPETQKMILLMTGAAGAVALVAKAVQGAAMGIGNITKGIGMVIGASAKFREALVGGDGIVQALSAAVSPAGLVVAAIIGIAAAAALIITHWEPIKGFFKGLWDDIKGIFSGVGEWFTGIFTGAANGVKTAWNGIGSFFTGLWNGVKQVFVSTWNGIKTAVMTIVNVFVQGILNIWGSMKTGIETIMNGLKSILSGIWLAIKTVVLGPVLLILDLVTGNFKKLSSDSQGIFNNLKTAFSTIWAGIKQVFSGAVQAITGLVKTEWNGIKAFASTLWNSVGEIIKTAWSGFKSTISTLCNDISAGIKNVWNGILNWFKQLPGKLGQIGSDMFTKMKEGINSTIHGVGDAVKTGISTAFGVIKNLPSEALQWGKDIINGIVSGIKSAAHAVGDAVNGVAQDIRKFLHFSVPDEGPLADFDTYMPDMMHLMAEGITNNLGVVTDATKQVAGSIADESGKAVDTAVSVVKGRLGITFGSSTVTADVGFKLGRGLSDGIEESKTVVLKTAKNMSNLLADEETRLQNQIADIQKQTAAQTQKSNEEILQDNLNAQLKIVQDFKQQYDAAIAEVEKAQADMSNKLLAFGDLFTKTQSQFGDMLTVNDLQSQIDAINDYGDALEQLKARGVSDSLLDKVKDMSIEDATQYTTQLLSMTDEQYGKYMTLWDQKQQAAKSVAEKFYKGELDMLKAEYVDKIPSELSGIKDQMQDIGVMSGQGLAAGFASQSEMITATFVGVLQAAYAAAKESMDIHSPSRKWAYIGEQNAAGLGVGFIEKMKSVTKQMNDSIPTNIVLGSNETPSAARMSEGLVNGLAAVLGTQQGGPVAPGGTYKINVMMPNGDVLASAVFDPLRSLTKQKGVALT